MTLDLSALQAGSSSLICLAIAEKELTDAVKLFETGPGFARMELWLRDQMTKAQDEGTSESKYFGTRARADLALKWFDIRAEAFAQLITSMDLQNAFVTVLAQTKREAWRDFTGHYLEVVQPVSDEFCGIFESIHRRVQFWTRKGYERLVALEELSPDGAFGSPNAGPDSEAATHIDALVQDSGDPGVSRRVSPTQDPKAPQGPPTDRRALVDSFINRVAAQTGRRITRMDIWRAAGYTNRCEFERWQRRDPRTCQSAAINFSRILTMNAESFISLLGKHVQ
jgi:hypothetical protein